MYKNSAAELSDIDRTLLDHGIPYRNDKDNETPKTRSCARRIIQTIAVNSNSGQISDSNQQDSDRIKELNTFSFTPDETPLTTSQYRTDINWLEACGIGVFNQDDNSCLVPLPTDTVQKVANNIATNTFSYNNFTTVMDNQGKHTS